MSKFCSTTCLVLLLSLIFTINAGSQQHQRKDTIETGPQYRLTAENAAEIEEILCGAVENNEWMQATSRRELHEILNRYFTGKLLEDITEQTWRFICLNSDWYGIATVEKMNVESIDGNMVTVLAYIKEVDVISGSSVTLTGKFSLTETSEGWRIKQMVIQE